ncbi:hypothetical protein NEF87_004853 [Candidatus Lokiarchaeum ossiferum]|uniref:GIY-YIG domain-containing protein n=1 Tax=Candidatus Lokiarchaeum ossiferum TaxID=2951803 RepID=A0ABY6HYF8_9ARCH|nr:hypothetical protein NEF87_004853 [Candidatus Lokiarchaeum sp. B-35]
MNQKNEIKNNELVYTNVLQEMFRELREHFPIQKTEEKLGGIYIFWGKPPQEEKEQMLYIGSTKNFKDRITRHFGGVQGHLFHFLDEWWSISKVQIVPIFQKNKEKAVNNDSMILGNLEKKFLDHPIIQEMKDKKKIKNLNHLLEDFLHLNMDTYYKEIRYTDRIIDEELINKLEIPLKTFWEKKKLKPNLFEFKLSNLKIAKLEAHFITTANLIDSFWFQYQMYAKNWNTVRLFVKNLHVSYYNLNKLTKNGKNANPNFGWMYFLPRNADFGVIPSNMESDLEVKFKEAWEKGHFKISSKFKDDEQLVVDKINIFQRVYVKKIINLRKYGKLKYYIDQLFDCWNKFLPDYKF